MKSDFAYNLKRLRKNAGMTQADVARRIGVTENSIVNYEKGFSKPNENRILLLSKLFQVTPSLLKGTVFDQTDRQQLENDFEDYLWKVQELDVDPVKLRFFLLEYVNQMSNELLIEAVTSIYCKTLEEI